MKLVDKFLYKLAIMTFLLLLVITMDRIKLINFQGFRDDMSDNFNFLKIINTLNGKTNVVIVNLEDEVSVSGNLYKTKDITNGKRVILDSYEAVESLNLGIVVKIEGNIVYILDNNDYLYCYKKLESIDVNLYQIIRKNQIIGKASVSDEGVNYYDVYVSKHNKVVDPNI